MLQGKLQVLEGFFLADIVPRILGLRVVGETRAGKIRRPAAVVRTFGGAATSTPRKRAPSASNCISHTFGELQATLDVLADCCVFLRCRNALFNRMSRSLPSMHPDGVEQRLYSPCRACCERQLRPSGKLGKFFRRRQSAFVRHSGPLPRAQATPGRAFYAIPLLSITSRGREPAVARRPLPDGDVRPSPTRLRSYTDHPPPACAAHAPASARASPRGRPLRAAGAASRDPGTPRRTP